MCHTEHVYHTPCSHWGRTRFVGDPCIRSRVVNGRHTGCSYVESLGTCNSSELCHECQYREALGGSWRPFAGISDGGWREIEEKVRKRSVGLEGYPYDCQGRRVWWFGRNMRRWWGEKLR
ncbi:hypothetical protein BU16DRAFT_563626 [Lophium mytilinum]|uniref:Uncharacterized protein n=1 Tax=Lophium mytilinum TaxID=390894 RepID=A0A6A6QLU6_9PEZI|nr:hypothetical protein BU16DRAFT_563626 [Lophium mytilinum]